MAEQEQAPATATAAPVDGQDPKLDLAQPYQIARQALCAAITGADDTKMRAALLQAPRQSAKVWRGIAAGLSTVWQRQVGVAPRPRVLRGLARGWPLRLRRVDPRLRQLRQALRRIGKGLRRLRLLPRQPWAARVIRLRLTGLRLRRHLLPIMVLLLLTACLLTWLWISDLPPLPQIKDLWELLRLGW